MKSVGVTDFRVGERVPGTDWVMRGVVGQGGMGVVLEVRKGRNLRAAMKILRPAFARSAKFEARFAEEVEVMARLRSTSRCAFSVAIAYEPSPERSTSLTFRLSEVGVSGF